MICFFGENSVCLNVLFQRMGARETRSRSEKVLVPNAWVNIPAPSLSTPQSTTLDRIRYFWLPPLKCPLSARLCPAFCTLSIPALPFPGGQRRDAPFEAPVWFWTSCPPPKRSQIHPPHPKSPLQEFSCQPPGYEPRSCKAVTQLSHCPQGANPGGLL